MERRVIGIYGGSFNPPTLGHLHVVKEVIKQNIIDELWIVPSFIHFHGKKMVNYEDRIKMCEYTFSAKYSDYISDDNIIKIKKVDEAIVELNDLYDGSMISLLENLRRYNDHDFRIIIGEDNAESILSWKNGDKLIKKEKFITIPRLYVDEKTESDIWFKTDPNVYLNESKMIDISSTQARERMRRIPYKKFNMSSMDDILSPLVTNYIMKNNLYRLGV